MQLPRTPRREFLKTASAVGLAACAPLAGAADAEKRPNLLLICAEDMGPTVGCYGDTQAQTPNLDKLAAEGIRFDNAYVTQASCSPSRSSILTGLYPHQTGQLGLAHYGYAMLTKPVKMPNRLKRSGYMTGIMGKLHVGPEKSFQFDYRGIPHGKTHNPDAVAKDFRNFLAKTEGKPFLFYLNLIDAHAPFLAQVDGFPENPTTPEDVRPWPWLVIDTPQLRKRVADYYNGVRRVDLAVGEVMKALGEAGLDKNTLVVFIGDHGPAFCRGKTTNYEAGLKIPFLVRQPGTVPSGQARSQLISTVDLLPTFLTAAGMDLPKQLAGAPLQPLLQDAGVPWRDTLCAEFTSHGPTGYFPRRSIRDARYKLILNLEAKSRGNPMPSVDGCPATRQALAGPDGPGKAVHELTVKPPEVELYDLSKDPSELRNLADDPALADVRARLLKELAAWRETTSDPTRTEAGLQALTAFQDGFRAESHRRVEAEKKRLGVKRLPRGVMHKCMQLQPTYDVPGAGK
jgi:N-sulfoglucosamine sulfohydrolase